MIIVVAVVCSVGITQISENVYAQAGIVDGMSINTDKQSYTTGDTIFITGVVEELYRGNPVTILIQSPSGNIIKLDQITVDSASKSFSMEYVAGGSLMNESGTHSITATYGVIGHVRVVTFEYVSVPDEEPVDESLLKPTHATVEFEGSDDIVSVSIVGGNLVNVVPTPENSSLNIVVNSTIDGSITITLPRSVLDSTSEVKTGDDDAVTRDVALIILVDGVPASIDDYTVVTTETERIITVNYPAQTENIQIIGTWAIPEFGVVATMMLAIAIVSVVIFSTKSKLCIIR